MCESPLGWPGVHTARQLVDDEKLEGVWLNRSKEWAARNRGDEVQAYDYATRYEIGLSQLPAFQDLQPEAYQGKIASLVHDENLEGVWLRHSRAALREAGEAQSRK